MGNCNFNKQIGEQGNNSGGKSGKSNQIDDGITNSLIIRQNM